MAGLTTYGDFNKVESTTLKTIYTTEVLEKYKRNTYTVNPYAYNYKHTRTRTKNYSFVGMTKATAISCMNAKIAQYTRKYWTWSYYPATHQWKQNRLTGEDYYYHDLVANIECSHVEGDLWDVNIQVNEVAVVYCYYRPVSYDSMFNAFYDYEVWSYDE